MVFELLIMVKKRTLNQTAIMSYCPLPFYLLTAQAPYDEIKYKSSKIKLPNISKRYFEIESVFEFKNKKRAPKKTKDVIDMMVSTETRENTIETLRLNGAKNIKQIRQHLPLPKYCPNCDKLGRTSSILENRYQTRHHTARIYYGHRDKSRCYVGTFDVDNGRTTPASKIDPKKFLSIYWVKKLGTTKNGITTLESD